jgi:hypothetical protein
VRNFALPDSSRISEGLLFPNFGADWQARSIDEVRDAVGSPSRRHLGAIGTGRAGASQGAPLTKLGAL